MAVTQAFMEAVLANKMMRVRIMLKDSLLVDPTATQFDEMAGYADDQMGGIYVEHDGEVLKNDSMLWDEDYLNEQMVVVVNNFSKERIALLKNLVRFLYGEKAEIIAQEAADHRVSRIVTRKQIGSGATIVGAALVIAGICTSQPVLAAGGVVIAATGAALIISDKVNM